ncbi:SDR family NAD(P)-dependent oxidoreductase [Amorphus sp. MBR-141]
MTASQFEPDTVAVVTGASSGIGRACAVRLAERGARVVVGYNSNADAAGEVVAGLEGSGHIALRMSIGEAESVTEAAREIGARFGRVDVLVNNGGFTTPVPIDDLDALTDEIFDAVVRVNLRGPFAMVRALRPLLEVPNRSVIVNVSSIAARTGVGSNLAYCAAKAGVDALTIGLAKLLAPKIRVLAVAPAGVDTGFVEGRTHDRLQAIAEGLPLRHLTTPDDVAKAVMACVSELTSATGISIPVDEGRHL